jgi:uncharacterized protein YaaQ
MPEEPIQKLITAVVQEQDEDLAMRALNELKVPVFHLASAGGFLGRRNATLLIGLRGDDAGEFLNGKNGEVKILPLFWMLQICACVPS